MKALILNSGTGSRMGSLTAAHPKCMTEIGGGETILSRQLRVLAAFGISEVVITTGPFEEVLQEYVSGLGLPVSVSFVHNPRYKETNYIYSMYLAREELAGSDVLLMHGDLVFEEAALSRVLGYGDSRMAVSSSLPLPEKDFKAVLSDEPQIIRVGVSFFEHAVAAQPLYYFNADVFGKWMERIAEFCESGRDTVYAENALNELCAETGDVGIGLFPADVGELLCAEIDNAEDLKVVSGRLAGLAGFAGLAEGAACCGSSAGSASAFGSVSAAASASSEPTVYLCCSTDVIHGGHIALIRRAQRLGRLVIGVLSDEAVASYKRYPLVPEEERKVMFENIAGVSRVVLQKTLSYRDVLLELRPDYVVHGDDWVSGFQKPIRDEVLEVLASYGGKLVEFPYSREEKYREIEKRQRADLAMPDLRRGRLKRLLAAKGLVRVMEAHDGLTGLVVENTVVHEDGGARQYDAMWLSSLCDSTAKGKPDIELVDMTSRFRTVDDIMEVTTKPIIFDGDTGGLTEHFVYTVRTLERMGVSMVIIEDKTGLKKNSLFGTEVKQTQDSIEHFSEKIRAGKKAQRTRDFMICARIESLILEAGMEDALSRAFAFVDAGADAIMIHSRKKNPAEIFEFLRLFREKDVSTPVVLVPTSFNSVKEEEWKERGANVIIYANQLMRAAVPAIRAAAESILENHRAEECDRMLMPFSEIIRMIPEEN